MDTGDGSRFWVGVIEGFYGPPWSLAERRQVLESMPGWGLNTYLYCPKDDLKHRALWRENYSVEEAAVLGEMARECSLRGVRFVYGIGPGLDIRYSDAADLDRLKGRLEQLRELGCRHFAILFDDIPDQMRPEDRARWGSFASAQCAVANALWDELRRRDSEASLFFCPTPYCGRMASRGLGGADYLATVGKELALGIEVFWTGPEIVSSEISLEQARTMRRLLNRKPLLWDNLHANDYDGRRFYVGPYGGRDPRIREELAGILSNPNTEFELNYVPLRTLGEFCRCEGVWDARKAYLGAMESWAHFFEPATGAIPFEDVVLLGDAFYLPKEFGPTAGAVLEGARRLLRGDASMDREEAGAWLETALRLKNVCARVSELKRRPLFYALSRRVWELREELDLLIGYVRHRMSERSGEPFGSDFHLPGTYRGGMVAELQPMLKLNADGTVRSAIATGQG